MFDPIVSMDAVWFRAATMMLELSTILPRTDYQKRFTILSRVDAVSICPGLSQVNVVLTNESANRTQGLCVVVFDRSVLLGWHETPRPDKPHRLHPMLPPKPPKDYVILGFTVHWESFDYGPTSDHFADLRFGLNRRGETPQPTKFTPEEDVAEALEKLSLRETLPVLWSKDKPVNGVLRIVECRLKPKDPRRYYFLAVNPTPMEGMETVLDDSMAFDSPESYFVAYQIMKAKMDALVATNDVRLTELLYRKPPELK